jgi:hypothetical protein
MKNLTGSGRAFAVASYSRAKDGFFSEKPVVLYSRKEVLTRVIATDAALRGILAALREMRAICVSAAETDGVEIGTERSRLEELKSEVSRLAESVTGLKFAEFRAPSPRDGRSVEEIDGAIGQVSGFADRIPDPAKDSDEKLNAWMKSLLGEGQTGE